MAQYSIHDEIEELQREIALREAFYPNYVSRGRLPQWRADKQLGCLKKTLQRLLELRKAQQDTTHPKLF